MRIAAALVAALIGSTQQGRDLRHLREEVEALARPRLVEPGEASTTTRVPRVFAGRNDSEEKTPVALLNRVPGMPVVGVTVAPGRSEAAS